MKRPPAVLLLLLLVVGALAAACGDTLSPAAATVNGKDISQKALDGELEAIEDNTDYVDILEQSGSTIRGSGTGTLDSAFVGRVLTRQIFLELVRAEMVRKNLTTTDADLKGAEATTVEGVGGQEVFDKFSKAYRDTLTRRTAEVAKLQGSFGTTDTSAAAVKSFYDANPDRFAQTCVSHILFAAVGADGQVDQAATATQSETLQASAATVKSSLDSGADFNAAVQQYSVDTGSKAAAGSLECGAAGRFVEAFETSMNALPINQVSSPVQTEFGWHLIKVTSRAPQTLEEATPTIQQELESASTAGFSTFLQEALDAADITVNPRYGTFDKTAQSPGVVPPASPGSPTTVPGATPTP